MPSEPSFDITSDATHDTGSTLVIGLSHLGMAGITAVDYLVKQVPNEEIGHILPEELPAITPFQDGTPRHHTRIYNLLERDMTAIVGELFIPVWAAHAFSNSLLTWIDSTDIAEIVILHGVPYPHGPDEHAVFHVSTTDFRDRRLIPESIAPLAGGFLDGTVGELVTKSLESEAPPTGVFITPTHPPGPDIDASLLLLDALTTVYGFDIDASELEQASEELKQYYEELDKRLQSLTQADHSLATRDFHEDRMFM